MKNANNQMVTNAIPIACNLDVYESQSSESK